MNNKSFLKKLASFDGDEYLLRAIAQQGGGGVINLNPVTIEEKKPSLTGGTIDLGPVEIEERKSQQPLKNPTVFKVQQALNQLEKTSPFLTSGSFSGGSRSIAEDGMWGVQTSSAINDFYKKFPDVRKGQSLPALLQEINKKTQSADRKPQQVQEETKYTMQEVIDLEKQREAKQSDQITYTPEQTSAMQYNERMKKYFASDKFKEFEKNYPKKAQKFKQEYLEKLRKMTGST